MLSFLLTRKRLPIVLDVGLDSIKMLQMQQVGQNISIIASARKRIADTDALDDKQRQKLQVAAVRDMLREGRFRGRRVVSALSCRQLNMRNIRLPHMAPKEMAEAVYWEAKELFGFELSADRLYHINAGPVRQDSENRDEIILIAVTKDVIDAHMAFLTDAGLKPERIDAAPVALFRAFERFLRRRADEDAVTVVVDAGYDSTRLVVARGRGIVFIKDIPIGGRKFNEAVARQLNLSVAEAAEMRLRISSSLEERTWQQDPPPAPTDEAHSVQWALRDAVREELEALAKEISLCLRYCAVTFRGLRPEKVLITGGEAYDPAVCELLSEQLNLQCRIGRPLKGIDVSVVDLGADRREMLSEWAVCSGMAVRDLNLKPMGEAQHGPHRLSA